jgi:hypothetical protein
VSLQRSKPPPAGSVPPTSSVPTEGGAGQRSISVGSKSG